MTEKEKKAFEFAKKEFGSNCSSVRFITDAWKGYSVYCLVHSKIQVVGMPTLILEKDGKFSTKQDYECVKLLSLLPDEESA